MPRDTATPAPDVSDVPWIVIFPFWTETVVEPMEIFREPMIEIVEVPVPLTVPLLKETFVMFPVVVVPLKEMAPFVLVADPTNRISVALDPVPVRVKAPLTVERLAGVPLVVKMPLAPLPPVPLRRRAPEPVLVKVELLITMP